MIIGRKTIEGVFPGPSPLPISSITKSSTGPLKTSHSSRATRINKPSPEVHSRSWFGRRGNLEFVPSPACQSVDGPALPPGRKAGDANTILISHGFWQRRFGASPDAVGSTLHLDSKPQTIVGVMPKGFRFLQDVDLWRLINREDPYDKRRDSHSYTLVGRLKQGVSIEQAQSDVDAIAKGLEQKYPDTNKGKGLYLMDLHGAMVSRFDLSLLLLMATTVLVLLIACGNVAGLLLARGQQRLSEIAMRTALGAPRKRLVRQLLTESLILTMIAGIAGIAVAYLFQDLLLQLLPMGDTGIDPPTIDGAALTFALRSRS